MVQNINSTMLPTIDDLCSVIAANLNQSADSGIVEVNRDTELLLAGLLDSLTVVKIVAEIERRMGTELPESIVVARNFHTPATLHDALGKTLDEVGR